MNANDKAKPAELPSNAIAGPLSNRSSLLLFALAAAVFIAARLWGLTASCLWFDEVFSVHAARHGWTQIAPFIAADIIHPPLFYALLKVWIGIGGESLLWLRLFAALTSVASILPFFLLCRELKLSTGETNLALLLMAVNGFLIKYAQEVRMYSLLLFFSLCSLWLFVRFIKAGANSRRQLLALFLVNLLLVYSHYSGWAIVALQAVVLLLCKRTRLPLFLISVASLVLAYCPWIYAVSKAAEPGKGLAQNIGWVVRPRLADVAQSLTILNKPFLFGQSSADALFDPLGLCLTLLLFIFPLLVLMRHVFKARPAQDGRQVAVLRGLFLFSFAPAVIFFLLSWILPYSIWGTRHLIIAAGPYSILAAVALKRLRPYWIRTTVFLLLGCWFLLAGTLLLLQRPPVFIWCAWEQLALQMIPVEADASQVVQVYAYEDLVAYHLWFTLATAGDNRFKVTVIKGVPGMNEDPAYFLPRRFSDIAVQNNSLPQGDHVWLAFRAMQWKESQPPLNDLTSRGYHVGTVLKTRAQGQEAFLVRLSRQQE